MSVYETLGKLRFFGIFVQANPYYGTTQALDFDALHCTDANLPGWGMILPERLQSLQLLFSALGF